MQHAHDANMPYKMSVAKLPGAKETPARIARRLSQQKPVSRFFGMTDTLDSWVEALASHTSRLGLTGRFQLEDTQRSKEQYPGSWDMLISQPARTFPAAAAPDGNAL